MKEGERRSELQNMFWPYTSEHIPALNREYPTSRVPKDFQITGTNVLLDQFSTQRRYGFALTDQPGIGKTKQSIDAARVLLDAGEIERVVVFCPLSMVLVWEDEVALSQPELTCQPVWGTKEQRWEKLKQFGKITVINYEAAKSFGEPISYLCRGALLICDEAHRLKNSKSDVHRLVRGLPARYYLPMTGTPCPNEPIDLYGQMQLLSRYKQWADEYEFRKRYVISLREVFERSVEARKKKWAPGQPMPQLSPNQCNPAFRMVTADYKNLGELGQMFGSMAFGRLSQNTLSLDEPVHNYRRVRLEGDQATMYRKMEKDDLVVLDSSYQFNEEEQPELWMEGGSAKDVRLHNIISGALPYDNERYIATKSNAKLSAVLDIMDEEEGAKIVIWCWFRPTMAMLRDSLKKFSPALVRGGMSTPKQKQEIDRFRQDSRCSVFIGQIQACGEGITLVESHRCVFYERSWQPDQNYQAWKRLHRLGQLKLVIVDWLEAIGTKDEEQTESLSEKAAWQRQIYHRGDNNG